MPKYVCAGVAASLLSVPLAAALPPGSFGWMAELAGSCWQGRSPDGKTTDTQCYSVQFDRYLRGTIEVKSSGAGKEPYLGDSVFMWDAATSEMKFHYWGSGGNNGISTGKMEGEAIVFSNPPSLDPNKPLSRTVWTRSDSGTFRVTRQRQVQGGWQDDMAIVYTRVPTDESAGQSR